MARQQLDIVLWMLTAIVLAALLVLVESQGQIGFISIDCGSNTSYTELTTGINYVPDAGYISSGESKVVATEYTTSITTEQFGTLRSFPEGAKNCYILPQPSRNASYLIRAGFMYGNYDSIDRIPEFDLYIGVNFWKTVNITEAGDNLTEEMMHTPPASDPINVCLVNKGIGIPFISVLELRTIKTESEFVYNPSETGSMNLYNRLNFGSGSTYRYRYTYDVYDRIWNTIDWTESGISNIATDQSVYPNSFNLPSEVMSTAVTPTNPNDTIDFYIGAFVPEARYYFYLHFAEIQKLTVDEFRGFDIYLNDTKLYGPVHPQSYISFSVNTTNPITATSWLNFSLRMTANSTLPPILNAFEAYYTLTYTSQLETDSKDAEAINNIKSAYNVSRIWQGDPCAPQKYPWDGLKCSFTDNQSPRIISLDLSSSGLNGKISNYISGLIKLQKLDLSNNNLIGSVPEFLSTMTSLIFLDLSGNNLTGTVPAELVRKSEAGSLTLNIERNPHLCLSNSCNNGGPPGDGSGNKKKKTSLVIPIVAAVAGVVILIILALFLFFCIFKKNKPTGGSDASSIVQETSRFTFSDVLEMTNDFVRVIGRGGFGSVYYGCLNGVEVAVKMLSPSSSQGYKEFKAEAQILMKVHHRNLTSLIGYCDEGENMGLIYEFMAQGDLHSHISADKNSQYLTWEERLSITVDAAQGLEYLHHGCKPPLVHRDIKSNNILLNDKLEAKLADFGLSRACTPDVPQTGFVQTMMAGTPGYLDPEYYQTQQLNEKSDVFSYGIVLLEVITSKPVMVESGSNRTHISKWVDDIISTQGDIKAIIDPRMRGDYDTNSVWKAVEVAMSCVKQTSNQRPSMSEVVMELSQCLIMEKARKQNNETGFTNNTMDSDVEMVSLGINNAYTPSPR